jgi:adenylate cyclase
MGSAGSLGQTVRSDLDYWVCYRPSQLNGKRLELFRAKLATVSRWAHEEHGTEANFYLVDLSLLERGQISRGLGQDVGGDAAPLLLLEEVYRTLVLVAGRAPLWAAVPPGTEEGEYAKLVKAAAPLEWDDSPPPFVDMGFPRRPEPQEYLAAAMWLTYKSEAYPFKGILKIIPILEAVETGFTAPLLCDVVKAEIVSGESSGPMVDPYLITVERVIAYASSRLEPDQTDLIRDASVLKILGLTGKGPVDPGAGSRGARDAQALTANPALPTLPANPALPASPGPQAPPPPAGDAALAPQRLFPGGPALPPGFEMPDPFKASVLERWTGEWGWGPERLARLMAYDSWSERERLQQGNAMLLLLFGAYMRISNRLMTLFPDQVDAQDEELTPFAARIMGRQRGLEATVDLLPSQFHRDGLSKNIAVHRDPAKGAWSVYALALKPAEGGAGSRNEGDLVYEAGRAVKAAAWLVRNRLCGEGFTVCLDPAGAEADPEAFLELLDAIAEAFPPVPFRSLDPDSIWLVGAQGPVLLAFNFESPPEEAGIASMDAVFRTGWGEIRHEWLDVGHLPSEADKCLALASLLSGTCGVADASSLVRWGSKQPGTAKRAFSNVKAALAASLARTQAPTGAARSLIDL